METQASGHLGSEDVRPFHCRVCGFVVALVALIVFTPVMAVIAVIIKLDTPGPVLFFQRRIGLNGKPFWFVKFRTMYVDARERFPELYEYRYDEDELRSLHFKVKDDPRVTPQGRWLRRTTLDELPNFWNVLTGQMALVGPRPEIPEMMPYYEGRMLKKFSVRPGITGLAQCSGRGDLDFLETVEMDVRYVETRSLALDLWILWHTVVSVLLARGAF